MTRHRETAEQGSSLASHRACHSLTQAHHRVSKVKQKTCVLRKQRGYSSECSYLVLKIPDKPQDDSLLTVNSVGFVISEGENCALGPKDVASVTQSFVQQKFYYNEKTIKKGSDTDIRRGQRVPHH